MEKARVSISDGQRKEACEALKARLRGSFRRAKRALNENVGIEQQSKPA
jgi:hypothetical protein